MHALELFEGGWVVEEEHLFQANCAKGPRDGVFELTVSGNDDLGAASADVNYHKAAVRMGPTSLDAGVDETGFFEARDDFDGRADRLAGAVDEIFLIAGVADGAGGDDADAGRAEAVVGGGEAGESSDQQIHRGLGDGTFREDAGAEAGDFAVGAEHLPRLAGVDFGDGETGGVTADIDGGVARHSVPP